MLRFGNEVSEVGDSWVPREEYGPVFDPQKEGHEPGQARESVVIAWLTGVCYGPTRMSTWTRLVEPQLRRTGFVDETDEHFSVLLFYADPELCLQV